MTDAEADLMAQGWKRTHAGHWKNKRLTIPGEARPRLWSLEAALKWQRDWDADEAAQAPAEQAQAG